jgi:hypothetical protein
MRRRQMRQQEARPVMPPPVITPPAPVGPPAIGGNVIGTMGRTRIVQFNPGTSPRTFCIRDSIRAAQGATLTYPAGERFLFTKQRDQKETILNGSTEYTKTELDTWIKTERKLPGHDFVITDITFELYYPGCLFTGVSADGIITDPTPNGQYDATPLIYALQRQVKVEFRIGQAVVLDNHLAEFECNLGVTSNYGGGQTNNLAGAAHNGFGRNPGFVEGIALYADDTFELKLKNFQTILYPVAMWMTCNLNGVYFPKGVLPTRPSTAFN